MKSIIACFSDICYSHLSKEVLSSANLIARGCFPKDHQQMLVLSGRFAGHKE